MIAVAMSCPTVDNFLIPWRLLFFYIQATAMGNSANFVIVSIVVLFDWPFHMLIAHFINAVTKEVAISV